MVCKGGLIKYYKNVDLKRNYASTTGFDRVNKNGDKTIAASQDEPGEVAERVVEITNPDGLHMRPAMQFVECANTFVSRISVYKNSQCVDGKSIMQMTMLAATQGTKLTISAEGSDAEQAAEALAKLLQEKTSEKTS